MPKDTDVDATWNATARYSIILPRFLDDVTGYALVDTRTVPHLPTSNNTGSTVVNKTNTF